VARKVDEFTAVSLEQEPSLAKHPRKSDVMFPSVEHVDLTGESEESQNQQTFTTTNSSNGPSKETQLLGTKVAVVNGRAVQISPPSAAQSSSSQQASITAFLRRIS
jgi:hypothetical protein